MSALLLRACRVVQAPRRQYGVREDPKNPSVCRDAPRSCNNPRSVSSGGLTSRNIHACQISGSQWPTQAVRHPLMLILSGCLFHVVDDQNIDQSLLRRQFESELPLYGVKKTGRGTGGLGIGRVTRLNRSMFSKVARLGSELPGPPRTAAAAPLPGVGGGAGLTDATSNAG
jgi:hypothetical protein